MTTPFGTATKPNGVIVVAVPAYDQTMKASKRVKPHEGGFRSEDGQTFQSLQHVAEAMSWAHK